MQYGWFAHPIFTKAGDYPQIMKDSIEAFSTNEGIEKSILPEFTDEEIKMIRGTADFMGLNHYTTYYCGRTRDDMDNSRIVAARFKEMHVTCFADKFAEQSASSWLRVIPFGLRKTLNWIRERYDNPEVVITENGFSSSDGVMINDCRRVNYYNVGILIYVFRYYYRTKFIFMKERRKIMFKK